MSPAPSSAPPPRRAAPPLVVRRWRRERAAFAVSLVRDAGRRIRQSARPTRIRTKSSAVDLLTATDLRIERLLRQRIRRSYPSDAIVGEEGQGQQELDLDRPTWFLDPVDGTTNYVQGIPQVACNVGFWDGEQIAAGATADVSRRAVYWAEAGRGAFVGARKIKASSTTRLEHAVVSTGFPYDRRTNPDDNLAEFRAIVPLVRDVRRLGCAGLDTAWTASGRLDGYWERGDGPWDWAVGALLIREAGGVAHTYRGDEWRPGDDTFVAGTPGVVDALHELITSARIEAGLAPQAGDAEASR